MISVLGCLGTAEASRRPQEAIMKPLSVRTLRRIIQRLPSDKPRHDPRKWYTTQKEHWDGWLREYHGVGAYGRVPGLRRDASFVFNHIVEPEMLLWLIAAAGVGPPTVESAKRAASVERALNQKSAVIRRRVPWELVATALVNSVNKVGTGAGSSTAHQQGQPNPSLQRTRTLLRYR
jgi:hypothetical protein